MTEPKIYFSDFYNVSPMIIESYGAFNISLLSDLPLFIDPFLLFNSTKSEYQELHKNIIKYLKFLKEKANSENDKGFIKYYYRFSEVGQNWLGFSASGNAGSALGNDFANNLNENLHSLFADFGKENVTKGSHLEKLCLISKGVGRDNISDFTTNLIKEFLLEYTQTFAKKYIYSSLCREFKVPKVKFNYETESWEDGKYYLPYYGKDFVILTPKDILTKDDIWINKKEMSDSFDYILSSLADDELRAKLNNYLIKMLGSGNPDKKKVTETKAQAYGEFPDLIDFYIRYKEDNGDNATEVSSSKVKESEYIYLDQFGKLASKLLEKYPSNEVLYGPRYARAVVSFPMQAPLDLYHAPLDIQRTS